MQRMTADEYRTFLTGGTARLAVSRKDGSPHIVPIRFMMDEEDLILTTSKEPVKGRDIRRDGRVAPCIDEDPFVLIEGAATTEERTSTRLDRAAPEVEPA